jgi:hypothetical protein
MAERSVIVKHAILAVSSSYVLDYSFNEMPEARANSHFQEAVQLLGQGLRNPENRVPGKGDALIASLILFSHNEVYSFFFPSRAFHMLTALSALIGK